MHRVADDILATMTRRYIALDLGAESGRAMLAALQDHRLTLEELHRFPNSPVQLPNGLYWDTLRLFHEICEGLRLAGKAADRLDGVAVDTFGASTSGLLGRMAVSSKILVIIATTEPTVCPRGCLSGCRRKRSSAKRESKRWRLILSISFMLSSYKRPGCSNTRTSCCSCPTF